MSRRIRELVPCIAFVFCYFATTVVGASLYMVGVLGHLADRVGPQADAAREAVGTPEYILLLYLPLVIVPAVALLSIRLTRRHLSSPSQELSFDISRPALWSLLILSVAFCCYRLNQFGALNLDVLNNDNYIAKTQRRMELLNDLGYVFYAFAYGINMAIPCMAFIAYVRQGAKKSDFILYVLSFAWFIIIVTLTYSKAPTVIAAFLLLCAALIMRASLLHSIGAAAIAVMTFFAVSAVMNIAPAHNPTATNNTVQLSPNSPGTIVPADRADSNPPPALGSSRPATEPPPAISQKLYHRAFDVLFRMAIVHPYVISIFKNPAERCGIQGNTLRSVLGLPPPACVLPKKLFSSVYPEVAFTQGQQPAPASLSAYAEDGIIWSIAVMIVIGATLGIIGVVSSAAASPTHIALAVAACSFAYFASQVPIVATFLYPHGFFVFLAPIVFSIVVSFATSWRSPRPSPIN